eukprot:CAMPEP_0181332880 /NCGR_PEP_ID=MMETSP1101-20121128/25352_1 /TAXON_ID=46948 /ORGANISM="Rhodomonas abbreviata, Strain Caron Lab Isolate" /LENGTH=169 /DNA_ID=CAMNT_0023442599 /DNA_START=102 /DNA_END=609 /DNA_ORIENTATION=+
MRAEPQPSGNGRGGGVCLGKRRTWKARAGGAARGGGDSSDAAAHARVVALLADPRRCARPARQSHQPGRVWVVALAAATADGEVMAWGLSKGGRLGVGELSGLDSEVVGAEGVAHLPVQVENVPWGRVQVATSANFSLLLFSDVDAIDAPPTDTPPLLHHLYALQKAGA